MKKSESITEISKALAKFQAEVKQPFKDADNPFFKSKYVPLESVVEAISECGPKNGLSFVQWPCNDDNGRVGVATLLMHSSGEFIEFDPVFMKAEKETPQGAGSLITYLKRYSLSAIYGITSDKDDDGNESSGNNKKPIKQKDVGLIKTRVKKLTGMRNTTEAKVYEALKVKDITKLSEDDGINVIEKLDGWIKQAEEKQTTGA